MHKTVKALVKKNQQYLSPKIGSFDQYLVHAINETQVKDHEMSEA